MLKQGPLFFYSLIGSSAVMMVLGLGMSGKQYSAESESYSKSSSSVFLPVPPQIQSSVTFWKRIYTEFHSDQRVIYHRAHPEVVYGIIDLSEIRSHSRSAFEFERKARLFLLSRLSAYRKAFKALEQNNLAKESPEIKELAQQIITAEKNLPHEHSYSDQRRALRVQTGQRDQVLLAIKRARPFIAEIERIFEKEKLPKELVYLSFVESSFNTKAASRSGAVGIWQFLENTGRKFLKIDGETGDERKDPIRSSIAAAKLLKENYRHLGRAWPLAITAYHHGYTALVRIPKAHRESDTLFDYFRLCQPKGKIGWTSRNYYSEFLAMVASVNQIRDINLAENDHKTTLKEGPLRL